MSKTLDMKGREAAVKLVDVSFHPMVFVLNVNWKKVRTC